MSVAYVLYTQPCHPYTGIGVADGGIHGFGCLWTEGAGYIPYLRADCGWSIAVGTGTGTRYTGDGYGKSIDAR